MHHKNYKSRFKKARNTQQQQQQQQQQQHSTSMAKQKQRIMEGVTRRRACYEQQQQAFDAATEERCGHRRPSKRCRLPAYMTLTENEALQMLQQDELLVKLQQEEKGGEQVVSPPTSSTNGGLHRRSRAVSWEIEDVFPAASYLHGKTRGAPLLSSSPLSL